MEKDKEFDLLTCVVLSIISKHLIRKLKPYYYEKERFLAACY